MRALFSITVLLLPLISAADVYKWESPDGRTHYSDRAVSGAESVGIQVNPSAEPPKSPDQKEESAAASGPYDSFEIVNPLPNQTIRNAEGKVELSLLLDPPLSADHRLQILVNEIPVPGDNNGTQLVLTGITFGSHRVQARIQDNLNNTIASSPIVDFHLRKPLPEERLP
ncbi:MAG: DUF4124 domain-containing protein [Chromatiaceae bacterium]|jgi:hypothetical protein|nr:DUF4124 domain-containing protein [Chromatiaceae bacterium]